MGRGRIGRGLAATTGAGATSSSEDAAIVGAGGGAVLLSGDASPQITLGGSDGAEGNGGNVSLANNGAIGSLGVGDYAVVLRNILRPFGMVLVTGPTGSGKSTSLYAMLNRLGIERQNLVNISTVEDPIEYTLPRVNQMAVNPRGPT